MFSFKEQNFCTNKINFAILNMICLTNHQPTSTHISCHCHHTVLRINKKKIYCISSTWTEIITSFLIAWLSFLPFVFALFTHSLSLLSLHLQHSFCQNNSFRMPSTIFFSRFVGFWRDGSESGLGVAIGHSDRNRSFLRGQNSFHLFTIQIFSSVKSQRLNGEIKCFEVLKTIS